MCSHYINMCTLCYHMHTILPCAHIILCAHTILLCAHTILPCAHNILPHAHTILPHVYYITICICYIITFHVHILCYRVYSYFILCCVARSRFWGKISMFSYHLNLVQKIQIVGHMTVWYQWQCHLPIVMLCSCLDNVTYPLWHDNGCLLRTHERLG